MEALERQRELIRRREPLRDRVHRYLRDAILSGRYSVGQRLTELEVAGELEISRTPVREAFRKLELEGLVRYEAGRGVTVTYLAPRDMPDIYAIMVALEGMAARLAALHMTEAEGQVLERLVAEVDSALEAGDLNAARAAHDRFNDHIFRAARNLRLHELLARFRDYIAQTQIVSWPSRLAQVRADHRALVEAIRSGDADRAERVMREHVERSRQAYIAAHGSEGASAAGQAAGRGPVGSLETEAGTP